MSDSFSFVFFQHVLYSSHWFLELLPWNNSRHTETANKMQETLCVNDPYYDKDNNLHNGNLLFKTK